MLEQSDFISHYPKLIFLMEVLLDSHSQRLIWDDFCHESIKNASSFIADLAQAVESFSLLSSHIEYKRAHGDNDNCLQNSDYVIRRVVFEEKSS
ncbi:hypothetical protein AB6A40_010995 [Gnathostoma spinigerum]|uniref:Uncharacterized protein n=1 Tax=Gnathostoma spinigerum TaxID=75299 RepID=A0ABD6EY65_9BILA